MQKLNQSQEQARHERLSHQMNLKRAQYLLYNQKNKLMAKLLIFIILNNNDLKKKEN